MLQKTNAKRLIREEQIEALSPGRRDHKAFSIPSPKSKHPPSDETLFNQLFPDIEEWALEEEFEPQTFLDFRLEYEEKLGLTQNTRTIFIIPLDEGVQNSRIPLQSLVTFASAYLGLPVEILQEPDLRITLDANQEFWLSEFQLESTKNEFDDDCFDIQCILDILGDKIPKNAYCVLGITSKDIYEFDEFHDENIVMGGGTGDRVGLLSLYRFDSSLRLHQFKHRMSTSAAYSRENSRSDATSRKTSETKVISRKRSENDSTLLENTSENKIGSYVVGPVSSTSSLISNLLHENHENVFNSRESFEQHTPSRRRRSESDAISRQMSDNFAISRQTSENAASPRKHKHILLETCKTLAHETLHMFGLDHCTHFLCVMNANVSPEDDGKDPIHLCPICLKKLHHVIGFNIEKRYKKLLSFYMENDWHSEVNWLTKRLDLLK